MKTRITLFTLAGLFCAGFFTLDAAERIQEGPKGGRILAKTEPRAEFFVEKDHTVSIHFYDATLKPIPAAGQDVIVIADAKSGKEKLEFEKKGHALVSKTKLPEGDGYNVVVQLRQSPEARPQNYRFKLDMHICDGCKLAEYGCICHE